MKKLLNAAQIRVADQYTIKNEPIASIDLMERASEAFVKQFQKLVSTDKSVAVVCGPGNNGGDAFAIARLLHGHGYQTMCYESIVDGHSPDCEVNRERYRQNGWLVKLLDKDSPKFEEDVIVDGLFGSGLSRPIKEGVYASLIDLINDSGKEAIAIDIPSGLFSDGPGHEKVVKADHTITFELPKISFLLPETGEYVGEFHVVGIGLDQGFVGAQESNYFLIEQSSIKGLLKKRDKFSHKGTYGRVQIVAGSRGKMGAAYLCGKACLRTGVGLLTMNIPGSGDNIIQTSLPEAMTMSNEGEHCVSKIELLEKTNVFCLGPGLGTDPLTKNAVTQFLHNSPDKPLVLDADALNIIAGDIGLLKLVPRGSILTPHALEFERLFGTNENSLEKFDVMRSFSQKTGVLVVSKGAHSVVSDEDGKIYFNTSGNPGMATAGSGDVLAGMIAGLLAQGMKSRDAAIAGVYLHGVAGDIARKKVGEMSLMASDLLLTISQTITNVHNAEII